MLKNTLRKNSGVELPESDSEDEKTPQKEVGNRSVKKLIKFFNDKTKLPTKRLSRKSTIELTPITIVDIGELRKHLENLKISIEVQKLQQIRDIVKQKLENWRCEYITKNKTPPNDLEALSKLQELNYIDSDEKSILVDAYEQLRNWKSALTNHNRAWTANEESRQFKTITSNIYYERNDNNRKNLNSA